MSFCEVVIEHRDGTKTVESYGHDPLREDAPRKPLEREIEHHEDWTKGRKEPDV